MPRQVWFQLKEAQTDAVLARGSVLLHDDSILTWNLLGEVVAQAASALPSGVDTQSLQVVMDGTPIEPWTRLDVLGLVEPVTLMTTRVFFLVKEPNSACVLAQGTAFLDAWASTVNDLRPAVFTEAASNLPPWVRANDLVPVMNGKRLDLWTRLDCVDLTKPVTMQVAVNPRNLKVSDGWPLGPLKRLDVADAECQLDQLFQERQEGHAVVNTPGLHAFWEGFGGFPSSYFVRKEEVMVWKVMKKNFATLDEISTVMVGSPGVGKSCFLLLVGMYFACVQKRQVLIIRCVAPNTSRNTVVYLDGQGSYARAKDVAAADLFALRKSVHGVVVLLDGFTQVVGKSFECGLAPFHFLTTSSKHRVKPGGATTNRIARRCPTISGAQMPKKPTVSLANGMRP